MLELDEYKLELQKFRTPLEEVRESLDVEGKQKRIAELDKAMAEPGFWDDVEKSGQIMKEIKGLKGTIESYDQIKQDFEDLETMIEMAQEENDEELIAETGEMLSSFTKRFEDFRIETLLSGEFDSNDCTVKINAGTYTARARLTYDTRNCEADEIADLKWTIHKANYDTEHVHWSYDKPFVYDAYEKSIVLRNVPKSIDVRYRDNRAIAPGKYTAKAYLTYDNENYETPEIDTTIDWEITGKE